MTEPAVVQPVEPSAPTPEPVTHPVIEPPTLPVHTGPPGEAPFPDPAVESAAVAVDPTPSSESASTAPAASEDPSFSSTSAPSPSEQIAAEVDAALEAAKAEGEEDKATAVATLKAQFEGDKAAAVAEAHRETGTLLVHGETLAAKVEASLASAEAGLKTLKTSSVNPIVSTAVTAFEAHLAAMWAALTHFKAATGKN